MKQTETYANRVQQFEQDQKKIITGVVSEIAKAAAVDTQNPYLVARLKVLSSYSEDRKIEIAAMERDGNINNRFYDAFIADVVTAAGEVPSLALRNRIKGI